MSTSPDGNPSEAQSELLAQGPDIVSEKETGESSDDDCPICMEKLLHPVKLPCGHIFCYLCCKGEGLKRKRCAVCRGDVPLDFFFQPTLVKSGNGDDFKLRDGFQWFYEGRDGWWQYDERSSLEIEQYFMTGESSREILIAGHLYVIDFKAMRQHRINQPGRFRRIKRDLCTVPKKGVAGLKINSSLNAPSHRHAGDGNVTKTETPPSSTAVNVGQTGDDNSRTDDTPATGSIPEPIDAITQSAASVQGELSSDLAPNAESYETTESARLNSNCPHSSRARTVLNPRLEHETVRNFPNTVQQLQEIPINNGNSSTPIPSRQIRETGLQIVENVSEGEDDVTVDQRQRNITVGAAFSPERSNARSHNVSVPCEQGSNHSEDAPRGRNGSGRHGASQDSNISPLLAELSVRDVTDRSEEGTTGVRRRQRNRVDNTSG